MSWIILTVASKFAPHGRQVVVAKHLIGKVTDCGETRDSYPGSVLELLTIGEVSVRESAAEVLAKLSVGVTHD